MPRIPLPLVRAQIVRQRKKDLHDARVVLQRVAHAVWGSASELWLSERVILVLAMWRRFAVFCACKRHGQGVPVFSPQLDKWDAFVESYHDRKLREVASRRFTPLVRSAWGGEGLRGCVVAGNPRGACTPS